MPRKRIIVVVSIAAALLLVAFLAMNLTVLFLLNRDDVRKMPFDATAWKSAPVEFSHESVRLRMVDDFLNSHAPAGKTRQQIVAMLGEPDDTEYMRSYDMVYQLGQERGAFPIDSEWLVMRLDDADIVTEARLTTD